MKCIKQVLKPWDGIKLLYSDLIDGPTTKTHSHTPILLGHKQGRNGIRAKALLD